MGASPGGGTGLGAGVAVCCGVDVAGGNVAGGAVGFEVACGVGVGITAAEDAGPTSNAVSACEPP